MAKENLTSGKAYKGPPASSQAARSRMLAAKQRDTKPEIELQTLLEKAGLQFEVNALLPIGLRRRADILIRDAQLAVFVDGCFWHGCPIHGTWPKQNAEFWRKKIETNKQRDRDTDNRLQEAGWRVIRVWEHQDMEEVSDSICRIADQLSN